MIQEGRNISISEKLPRDSKISEKVYNLFIEKRKPLNTDDIAILLGISKRSVRYAVNLLYDAKIVIKMPNLDDLRTSCYMLKPVK